MKKHARKAPGLVFLRPSFEVATVMTARFNSNRIHGNVRDDDYKNRAATVQAEEDLARTRPAGT